MKLAESNKNFFQRYHALLLPLMLALLSYAGIDGGTAAYDAYYDTPAPPAPTNVEVHVEAPAPVSTSPTHLHGKVYSREIIEQLIQQAIIAERLNTSAALKEAIAAATKEHEQYAIKETWQ